MLLFSGNRLRIDLCIGEKNRDEKVRCESDLYLIGDTSELNLTAVEPKGFMGISDQLLRKI